MEFAALSVNNSQYVKTYKSEIAFVNLDVTYVSWLCSLMKMMNTCDRTINNVELMCVLNYNTLYPLNSYFKTCTTIANRFVLNMLLYCIGTKAQSHNVYLCT